MKRRDVLANMAASAVATMGLGLPEAARSSDKLNPLDKLDKLDVLVIGAGMAGLAAAQALRKAGKRVLVLEARERIGGRTHTSNTWKDVPVDLGASWIHGERGNPLTKLADSVKAKRVATSYDSAKLYISHDLRAAGVADSNEAATEKWVGSLLRKAQKAESDRSMQQAINEDLSNKRLSRAGMAQINFFLNSRYEQEYGGAADELSAWNFDDAKEFGGGDVLFPQGYGQLVKGLSEGLNIRTGQVVQHIDYSKSPVQVSTQKGAFTADKLLITVPLGVLKEDTEAVGSIRFTPELPVQKREAMEALGMGLLNKHFFRFDQAFWDTKTDWHEYLSADKGLWTEWVSFAKAGAPVLLGFSAAAQARLQEGWSDKQIVDSAMTALRDMFGGKVSQPKMHQFTRWGQDPFSRGAYSFHAVGSGRPERKALSQPLQNRLFWAGEACSADYWGTVHGAYLSGQAAAAQILA